MKAQRFAITFLQNTRYKTLAPGVSGTDNVLLSLKFGLNL